MREPETVAGTPPEHKFSGAARVLFGFVLGALFTLASMYYFYMDRQLVPRPNFSSDQTITAGVESARSDMPPAARSGSQAFASRLTYELSQLPQESIAVPVRPPVAVAAAAPVPAPPDEPATRIPNARPITATPPPARDRTQAIEQEAKRPEYRERAAAPHPRVFEGREVEIKAQPKLPDTPTRPITANSAVNTRAEIESERARLAAEVARAWPPAPVGEAAAAKRVESRTVIATAPASSPITRPTEVRIEPETKAAAPAAPASPADVDGRFGATREWLAGAAPTTHTIQLMGTNNEEQLKAHLKTLGKTLEPAKIYVFRTVAQGKPSITVVYGAYADRQAALQALEKLPPAIVANKPVLRTVNGIRAEMKQHKTDS
jgi:septal ring-binding cell division protein DamX